jgi:hypothetical protein
MRGTNDPSGLGRRGLRFRRHPQHQAGDARGLRGQRQFAARREVELSRLAPDFQHDGADRIAGQRVGGRPQRALHIGSAHGHEKPRIKAKFGQPTHRHRARFNLGEILPYPHQGPPACGAAGESGNKTGRRSALPTGLRKHFVQGAQGEPALQRRIGIGMPEPYPARRTGLAVRLDALDTAAQRRKRGADLTFATLLTAIS